MIHVYYKPDYVCSSFGFDTTRKSSWIADSLTESPIKGIVLKEPISLVKEQIKVVHAAEYVQAIETGTPIHLAESQGFRWDQGLWPMTLASNGGVVAAALAAIESGVAGSLSSGLHHARYENGAGCCTFNGLAIAARAAIEAGVKSVLILDFDAHCGGGTASLIQGDSRIWHVDVSTSNYELYADSEQQWRHVVYSAESYLSTINECLTRVTSLGIHFGLCLYNAGMDPFEGCSIGGIPGITKEVLALRERLVFEWCTSRGFPVGFVLAGGYIGPHLSKDQLIDLHRLTLQAAVDATPISPSK